MIDDFDDARTGISRRRFAATAAAGAGGMWAAPAVLRTVMAQAATSGGGDAVFGVQPETGRIVLVDATNGAILNSFAAPPGLAPGQRNIGLSRAEGGKVLLYVNSDTASTSLYRLDPGDGSILSIETKESWTTDGVSYQNDGSDLIFTSHSSVDVHRQVGYGSGEGFFWGPGSPVGGLGGDDHGREFGFYTDGLLHEYDPFTDTAFLNSFAPPAPDIEGVAYDGTNLYVSTASGRLFTLDPDTGAVRASVAVPGGGLYGLAACR